MKSWSLILWCALVLSAVAGGDKAVAYVRWWCDGHLAIAQAKDALEEAGVQDVDKAITVIAPSRSRLLVAGHVRTTGGTLPFTVQLGPGQDGKRRVVNVTVGGTTIDPTTRQDD